MSRLLEMQNWFAKMITTPLTQEDTIRPLTLNGEHIAIEAIKWIKNSPTLLAYQRLEIYNQQYWWRLLFSLKNDFPFLSRLFTSSEFQDEISVPYLTAHPPSHFSLKEVGKHLSFWIKDHYVSENTFFLSQIAAIDYAYNDAASAKRGSDLTHLEKELFFTTLFCLAPHVHLFALQGNLFHMRDAMLLQDHAYWYTHKLPLLEDPKKTLYFVLFRSRENSIFYKRLSLSEYTLLSLFKKKSSLSIMINSIDNEPKLYEGLEDHLSEWISFWISEHLLTPC
jgi:hypothetical protein